MKKKLWNPIFSADRIVKTFRGAVIRRQIIALLVKAFLQIKAFRENCHFEWKFLIRSLSKKSIEDIKGVVRRHKSKNRQFNGQWRKGKKRNNEIQNIIQKIKD